MRGRGIERHGACGRSGVHCGECAAGADKAIAKTPVAQCSAAASFPGPAGRVTAVPAGAAQGSPTAAIATAGAGTWPTQKSSL